MSDFGDFNSTDPLTRYNAHQRAKGRTTMPDPDTVRKQHRENPVLTPEGDALVRNLEVYVNELRVVCASLDLLEAQLNAMKQGRAE